MAHCHESQVYEWLPYNDGYLDQVPESEDDRRAWLRQRLERRFGNVAQAAREQLRRTYGEQHGAAVRTAETVSFSEYGRSATPDDIPRLFPFLPRGE